MVKISLRGLKTILHQEAIKPRASHLALVLCFLLLGCAANHYQPPPSTYNTSTTEEQIYTEPLYSHWVAMEFPQIISDNGWNLNIIGYQIGPDATVLMYSLSGSDSTRLLSEMDFSIVDDLGNRSQLLEVLPLAKIGKLEIGVMNFQTRQLGARELSFQIIARSDSKRIFESMISHFNQPISDQTDQLDTLYSSIKDGVWEQTGYRMSFLGFGVPHDLPVPGVILETAQGLEEPIANARAPWAKLPPGVEVTMLATLSIEDLEAKTKEYLAMQFLTERGVLGYFQGSVVSAIPNLEEASPAVDNPYPTP